MAMYSVEFSLIYSLTLYVGPKKKVKITNQQKFHFHLNDNVVFGILLGQYFL